MADSTANKAAKARNKAANAKQYFGDSMDIVNKIAKTTTGKSLNFDEEVRAGRIVQPRRINDTARTAARGSFIERRTDKKSAAVRATAAVTGSAPKKRVIKPTSKTASFIAASKAKETAKKSAEARRKKDLEFKKR